ncbi:MAG: hypothetical protein AB7K36_15425 [Chloroflexota bacterium]
MAAFRNAAIGLAIAFSTWDALARGQSLADSQAVSLMMTLVRCAAPAAPSSRPGAAG